MGRIKYLGRYLLNVGKIPLSQSRFIQKLTGADKGIIEYIAEFDGKDVGSESYRTYHTSLYVITRIMKPQAVVETGVFKGSSSFAILSALEKNEKGCLYSIDLPSARLKGKEVGWLVPENLLKRWHLQMGLSSDLLPDLLKDIEGGVDIFLHDSEHSYENMMWEYMYVLKAMREGGLILSHDISRNSAFKEFANCFSKDFFYMLGNLGGLKCP